MKNRTIALAILGGLILSALVPFAIPTNVSAQACTDARGNPIECPAGQDNGKKKRPSPTRPRDYKTATPTPVTDHTPTLVPSDTPVATSTKVPLVVLPGDDPHLLANSFAGPFSFWWLGLLALLLGGGVGFAAYFNRRFATPPEGDTPGADRSYQGAGNPELHAGESAPGPPDQPGSDKMEAQPHMQPGGDGSGPVAEYEEIAELEEVSHIDPGDSAFHKGDTPGSDKMGAQPQMKPGTNAASDDWELPEPHMKPGQDGFMK